MLNDNLKYQNINYVNNNNFFFIMLFIFLLDDNECADFLGNGEDRVAIWVVEDMVAIWDVECMVAIGDG